MVAVLVFLKRFLDREGGLAFAFVVVWEVFLSYC